MIPITRRSIFSTISHNAPLLTRSFKIKSMKARLEIPQRPKLSHEQTERINQNNISDYDIFQDLPAPLNNIEVVLSNGFRLKNGKRFICRDPINHPKALVCLSSEAYSLDLSPEPSQKDHNNTNDTPASSSSTNNAPESFAIKGLDTGFVEIDPSALSFLEIIHPKPEILVVGLGKKSRMLHPATRKYITGLGIQIELSTTAIAANNFDLLSTERHGVVGALLLSPNI